MSVVCPQPFVSLEIDSYGDVYTCCPSYINYNKIGNIYDAETTSLESIWYSKTAINLRKKILKKDYSLCNLDICRQNYDHKNLKIKYNVKPDLPTYVTLAYDKECNLQCITCRNCKIKNSKEKEEILNKKIDTLLFPLIKNAEIVALNGAGEAFFSSHSRLLIKKLAQNTENPNLKFNINTNGILFNENNCKELGIFNKINEIFVSLPALNETIYNQIMIGSNLEVVINNIKWMAKEYHMYDRFDRVTINTVVSDLNFRELLPLIRFAKELDIFITISPYQYWGTEFGKDYGSVAVWERSHKNHNEFVKILNDDDFYYDKMILPSIFKNLQEK